MQPKVADKHDETELHGLAPLQAENLRLRVAVEKARDRFQRIVDEPINTMSDAKALREILRQAKLGLVGA